MNLFSYISLPFSEQYDFVHIDDVVEASLNKCSGTLNRFGYSSCVFAVIPAEKVPVQG
jgi:hypothetical protein